MTFLCSAVWGLLSSPLFARPRGCRYVKDEDLHGRVSLCAGALLRSLHQAQRCQVPSALRAPALPPSGGVPRAAGEPQSAPRWIRLPTDVPPLPAEVQQGSR